MLRTVPLLALCLAATSLHALSVSAAAIKAPTIGCTTLTQAQKLALASQRDRKAADALSRPLVASRECIDLARGVAIDVEERRLPMACVRLTGDLSCFWIAAVYVNENPDSRSEGHQGRHGGGHRGGGGGMGGGFGQSPGGGN